MQRWIWEQSNYPSFTYDFKKLELLIEKVSKEQGYLSALMQTMNQDMRFLNQSEALMDEAINTSAIEGKILNRDSVKASINSKFGFADVDYNKLDESTDNLLEMLIDANINYDDDLTLDRLFAWHNALFSKGDNGFYKINVAKLRGEETMQVVGGNLGNQTIFYEAPPRDRLEDEIEQFLKWFNTSDNSLVKAATAHLWFVIIHPFDDGNGRVARAVTDMVLSKIEDTKKMKLYSMSSAINADRTSYYKALERTTGYIKKTDNQLDITLWCEWFLETLYKALIDAKTKLDHIVEKTNFWDRHRYQNLNSRQMKVLNFILDIGVDNFKGNLNKKKYMSISNSTSTTASRDMLELIEFGCIRQKEGTKGRNVSYEIVLEE